MTAPHISTPIPWRQPVLLALGFRPFYLLAASMAAVWIPLWVGAWHGHLLLPTGFGPRAWHVHEMLFGFTSAVLVGFLLTAIPNWTGRPTVAGAPLAGLAALWIAGRIAMVVGSYLPWQAVAAVDVAFLPVAAAAMLPPLITTRNRRNIAFPFVLLVLALANLAFHLAAAGILALEEEITRAVLGAVMVILVVMAGRVIPFFTKNRLPAVDVVRSVGLDWAALGATVLSAMLSVGAPETLPSGLAAVAAAAFLIVRALLWKPWETRKLAMLWVLHIGHAWIAVGLLLRAGFELGFDLPASASDHAFTIGGIGMLTLGMMAWTARGHTGRPIEATRLMTTAFLLMALSAVVRVFGLMVTPQLLAPMVGLSGVLWAVSFMLYLIEYLPILAGARVDGRLG